MRTYIQAKAMAKSLRAALAAKEVALSHSECLEIVSKQLGFEEWNMLAAKIALETGERNVQPETVGISLEPAVAVLRIGAVPDAKSFYIDYLGFAVDWGWRDNDGERSLYAQLSRSGVTLHLSTYGVERGAAELLIRMSGLDSLHAELSAKSDSFPLSIRHTPDDRTELQVVDPFGNRLRFSENNPPGTSKE